MKGEWPLFTNRTALIKKIKGAINASQPHSLAFALRICGTELSTELGISPIHEKSPDEVVYGGYPEVASLGYKIAANQMRVQELEEHFIEGVKRQKNRSEKALESIALDDVALLGFADGLNVIKKYHPNADINQIEEWLLNLINQEPERKIWTSRLRDLAGDILDKRGRLKTPPAWDDLGSAILELTLRVNWPDAYLSVELPTNDIYKQIFSNLVKRGIPGTGQLEEMVVWLRSFYLLVEHKSETLFPLGEKEKISILMLRNINGKLDLLARKNTIFQFVYSAFIIVFAWTTFFLFKERLSQVLQDRLSIIGVIVSSVGAYLYYAITQKEMNPKEIYSQIFEKQKMKVYKKFGFDKEQFGKITDK